MNERLLAKANELFSHIDEFKCSGTFEDSFKIASQLLKIRYSSKRLQDFFRWQMNLFKTADNDVSDCTINILCSDCMDELYPFMNSSSCSLELFQETDIIDVYLGNGLRAGKNLFAWNEERKKGWVIISPNSLEKFIGVSFSLSPLFSRMSNYLESRMIHSAAVVYKDKAILLAGLSGSGKSTLSAACLNYGMKYISDDTILYHLQDNMVYPICSTLHISQEVLVHLPYLNNLVKNGQIKTYPGRALKKHLDLSCLSDSFVNGAPASMIVCPQIADIQTPELNKISSIEALVPLLCSSVKLLGIHDNASKYMKGITEKLKNLPCYRFLVGPNLEINVNCLLQFMKKEIKNV